MTNDCTAIDIKTDLALTQRLTNFTQGSTSWNQVIVLETEYRPLDFYSNIFLFMYKKHKSHFQYFCQR